MDARFWLENADGERFYPVRMRDLVTGRRRYRVSPGGNTKADSLELDSLEQVAALVAHQSYKVRARPMAGGSPSLLGVGGRNKLRWVCMPDFAF